ncbi:MAG: hypothetical protein LBU47_07615 [Christensenellaceae bacterium]|nr:hypothetical protein [Christensenellaceae bacterium]
MHSQLRWFEPERPDEPLSLRSRAPQGEICHTALHSVQGASFGRTVRYVLLKNFEEVPLLLQGENGACASAEHLPGHAEADFAFVADSAREGAFPQSPRPEDGAIERKFSLPISRAMGSGEYILLALLLADEGAPPAARRLLDRRPSWPLRAMILFERGFTPPALGFPPLRASAAGREGLQMGPWPVQIGRDFGAAALGRGDTTTLHKLNRPVCVDLRQAVGQGRPMGLGGLGEEIPAVLLGFYDGSLLSEKYRCSIPFSRPCLLFPEWRLERGAKAAHTLQVFLFLYPLLDPDGAPFERRFLSGQPTSAGMTILFED